MMEKKAWRIMLRTLFAAVSPEERSALSQAISAQLSIRIGSTIPPRMLAVYQPRLDEPDIRPFLSAWLKAGGRLCYPRCDVDRQGQPALLFHEVTNPDVDLAQGPFGLWEPKSSLPLTPCQDMDLMLIPGAAFDRSGTRLGRGKGYYDRYLSGCPSLMTLAPVFPWQVVDQLPYEPHDVRIHALITPEGEILCGRAGTA